MEEDKKLSSSSSVVSSASTSTAVVQAGVEPTLHSTMALQQLEEEETDQLKQDNILLEKKLVRKIDLRLIPWLAVLYLMLSLDRNNIGNARLGGLEKDLNMTDSEFYNAVTIFFAGYVLFHIPSNLLLKRLRPSFWIAFTMVMWGICSLCQAFTHNAAGLIACRFFLGIFECGVGPSIPLLLSFWYQRDELALRVAIYFGSSTCAGAFAGAIAYGVLLTMDGYAGIAAWRWIFITEAIPTIVLGCLSLLMIPDLPTSPNKYWLRPEERDLAIQRAILSGNTDKHFFDKTQFWAALKDYKNWLSVVIYVGLNVALGSYAVFLPTIIHDLGFAALDAQLLSIPPYIAACCLVFFVSWNSDRTFQRGYHIMAVSALGALGYVFLLASVNVGLRYTGAILVACGIYPIIPLTLSWVSNNQLGHTKRAVSIAMVSMIAQAFAILGTQIYRTEDSPRFIRGHAVCLAFITLTGCAAGLLRFLLHRENRKRDRDHGVPTVIDFSTLQDIDILYDGHPQFRYAL